MLIAMLVIGLVLGYIAAKVGVIYNMQKAMKRMTPEERENVNEIFGRVRA